MTSHAHHFACHTASLSHAGGGSRTTTIGSSRLIQPFLERPGSTPAPSSAWGVV